MNASDIRYVEAKQTVFGCCLVRMRDNAYNAYNFNYKKHSGNPERLESPCAGIKCCNCVFSNRNSDLDTIRRYLSTFTNNVCYEDDLIMILWKGLYLLLY